MGRSRRSNFATLVRPVRFRQTQQYAVEDGPRKSWAERIIQVLVSAIGYGSQCREYVMVICDMLYSGWHLRLRFKSVMTGQWIRIWTNHMDMIWMGHLDTLLTRSIVKKRWLDGVKKTYHKWHEKHSC